MTSSSMAHFVRCFAIADLLKKSGHKVFFTSCTSKAPLISNSGYEVVSTYKPVNINDPKDQSVNFMSTHKKDYVNELKAEIRAANKIKPDVIIMAPAIFGPYMYYATNIPTLAIMDIQYMGNHSKGLMGISYSSDSIRHKITRSFLRPIFEMKFINEYLSAVKDIYADVGLRHDFKSRAEIYSPMKVLIPSDDIIEPAIKKDDQIMHIGPLFWDGFEKMKTDLTENKLRKFKGRKKLLYMTFGGSIFNKRIYMQILEPLKKLKYQVIVSLGPNFKRDSFPPDSEKLIIRNFVPGLRVSNFADIILNTGAQGSFMQALINGKPQICVPTIMDQAYYANRIEELGAGININKISVLKFSKRENFSKLPKDTGNRIIKAIEKINSNPNYLKNSKKLKKNCLKYSNNSKKIVQFIENYSMKNVF